MKIFFLLAALALHLVGALPKSDKVLVEANHLQPREQGATSLDFEVPTYFPLYRRATASRGQGDAAPNAVRQGHGLSPAFTHNKESDNYISNSKIGTSYHTPMKIGNHEFFFIFDTGSSDTWIVADDFSCFNITTGDPLSQSACAFGETYKPGPEFDLIEDENFDTFYGDNSFVNGEFGKVDVTLGGITVNAQVGLVHNAGWKGDGYSSGFIGLAYPSLGQAYQGTNHSLNNSTENQVIYNPIFTEMVNKSLIAPLFSVSLNRDTTDLHPAEPDGYLALGGLAPAKTKGPWAKAPIEYVEIGPGYWPNVLPYPQYQYYTITPDAFLIDANEKPKCSPKKRNTKKWEPLPFPNNTKFQTIIDTAATQIYLPTPLSNTIASLFHPPAIYSPSEHFYTVPCDAIAPSLAIQINGTIFPIDKRDMVVDDESGRGTCMAGVNDGRDNAPYVVGDVWLKNVLAVFDVGKAEMRFRAREEY